jgi:hypothetical protein
MSNTSRSDKQLGQPAERNVNSCVDPMGNFDQWAGTVKQQMLAALKKRERMRSTWD